MDLTLPRSSSAPRSSKKSESKEVDDLRNEVTLLRASLHEAHERNDSARDSEKRLRAFRGSALDLVAEIDSDGRFLYASPNHFDLLGWTPKELLGTACFDYVHPDERQAVADGLKSTIRSGRIPTTSICRFRHRNGSIAGSRLAPAPLRRTNPNGVESSSLAT